MKNKLTAWDHAAIEHLKDSEFAAEYFRENWEYQGPNKLALLLKALQRIALAKGMTEVSQESGVSRSNLYKMFYGSKNPSAKTLLIVMQALGVRLSIEQKSVRHRRQ
mgnify:CR=1 FL=1